MKGLKVSIMSAGKYKAIAHERKPLSQGGRDYLQSQIDYIYQAFVKDMALFRPGSLTLDRAEESKYNSSPWAEGKVYMGAQAIGAGLADDITTPGDLIYNYHLRKGQFAKTSAGATRAAASKMALSRMPRPANSRLMGTRAAIKRNMTDVEFGEILTRYK